MPLKRICSLTDLFNDCYWLLASLWAHLVWFSYVLASRFRGWILHSCFMALGMDLGIIFDGLFLAFPFA